MQVHVRLVEFTPEKKKKKKKKAFPLSFKILLEFKNIPDIHIVLWWQLRTAKF
jgi:hypothetical protein